MINPIRMIQNKRMLALVAGTGAGTKHLHTLLDDHPDLYAIPGYPLMYFYPHFFDLKKSGLTGYKFVAQLVERLPSIYDTSLMPGSECLDELGDGGNETLKVDKSLFISKILQLLDDSEFNSRNILLAIHLVHFQLFAKSYDQFPPTILYHIHHVPYLNFLLSDFPSLEIISTTRRPSNNINRRIYASYIAANKTKLDDLDCSFLEALAPSSLAYYHNQVLKFYQSNQNKIYIVDYEKLVIDEFKTLSEIYQYFKLSSIPKPLVRATFAGKPHKIRFYEKTWNKSIGSIRDNVLSETKSPFSHLDTIYQSLEKQGTFNPENTFEAVLELLLPTSYERELGAKLISSSYISTYISNALKIFREAPKCYNMLNGFYCFKWSTPKGYILISSYMRSLQENYFRKGFVFSKNIISFIRFVFYIIQLPVIYCLFTYSIIIRRIYQLDLIRLSLIRNYRSSSRF